MTLKNSFILESFIQFLVESMHKIFIFRIVQKKLKKVINWLSYNEKTICLDLNQFWSDRLSSCAHLSPHFFNNFFKLQNNRVCYAIIGNNSVFAIVNPIIAEKNGKITKKMPIVVARRLHNVTIESHIHINIAAKNFVFH